MTEHQLRVLLEVTTRFRERREKAGMSIATLAAKTEIPEEVIEKFENGNVDIDMFVLDDLCQAIGVDLWDII